MTNSRMTVYNYDTTQIILNATVLIVFIGFRGYVFTDWESYSYYYEKSPLLFDGLNSSMAFIDELSNNFPFMERGFVLYMIICKSITKNYFFLQIVSFIIDFIILFIFFKENIKDHYLLGFVFYILFNGLVIEFNLLRNAKAIMIFLLSLKYLNKRNMVKYFSLNIIGCIFHITSMLYLPLYFILNNKYPRKIIFPLFLFGNVIYIFQMQWCRLVLTSITPWVPLRLGMLLHMYVDRTAQYGITIGYLERFFSFIIIFYFSVKLCKINKINLIYINCYYLYSFIFLYFSEIFIILERVNLLFIFPYWVLYPQIYSFLKKDCKKIFLIILLFYGIIKMYENNNIIRMYDNILFNHKSYTERKSILLQYFDKVN
jgi:hypothetical protein